MTAAPAIEVQGLTKCFSGRVAVDRLTFSVEQNEIFGLVGPDGACKTTVMRMLAGVLAPDAGSIVIDGIDVVKTPDLAKEHFSYMPQRFGLYEDLTVEENVRFYADLFCLPRAVREERAARLLSASGMMQFRGRLAGQLSGGMKQKLGLSCSLIHTPKIVLLDEPTTGVDPVSRRDFWRILYDMREEGVTIVISTAYLDEAERCHRLALLHEGHLLECDTPQALKSRMPGGLIAITSPEARKARSVIEKCDGVLSVMLVGDSVHVHVDDAAHRGPEIARALSARGLSFDEPKAIAPSIEDLFINLQKPKDEQAA